MKWKLDHITKENGKWFAEIINETGTREHTGNLWGWDGMTYNSLKCILSKYYNIILPPIKELKVLKKNANRTVYTVTAMTKDEIEKKAEEILLANRQKWIEEHTFRVSYKYGNTYITCKIYDNHSEEAIFPLKDLLNLMGIDFWMEGGYTFSYYSTFGCAFHGENHAVGDFIQKFIDNGYRIVVD
jgi:hypothetical protein